uniref:LRRCT domain-containing protein n=1 Tax=Maylandia zebra TaxID=106582 RepID=A0A3P9BAW2_9CICH
YSFVCCCVVLCCGACSAFCPYRCQCFTLVQVLCADATMTSLPKNISREYLFSHTLEGSPQLTKLIFLDNQLKSIHCRAFEHLTELQELEISGNPLDHLFLGTFSKQGNLTKLLLNFNRFQTVLPGMFDSLKQLETLQMKGNVISDLPAFLFLNLQKLRLYLSDNQLESLPEDLFDHFILQYTVRLHGNPWKCDCHIWYLHDWVLENSKTMEMLDRVVCESPNFLKKRAVMSINKDQLVCHLSRDEMPDLSTCSLQASNGIMIIKCKVDICSPLTVKVQFQKEDGNIKEHIVKNEHEPSQCSNETLIESPIQ